MKPKFTQKGVGLIEVLVALLLLSVGVLGYSALQLKANSAAIEANDRTVAINIARDLAERMRVNRTAFDAYKSSINTKANAATCFSKQPNNYQPSCNETQMAQFDALEIQNKAESYGHTIRIDDCKGSSLNCIYVAWSNTSISGGVASCVDATGAYIPSAQCLVMEAF